MRLSLRSILFGSAVMLAAAGAAAQAQDVHTDFDHHANFRGYRTFCIDRLHAGDPFTEGRLRDALNYTLSHAGFQAIGGVLRPQDANPNAEVAEGCDIAVRAVGNVRDRREYTTFYNGWGPRWGYGGWCGWGGGWGGYTTVQDIPVGLLVVDLYDTHTRQLIFRGTAKSNYSSKPDKNTARMNKSIDKMFSKFPPKP